jgi:protein gp37
LSSTSRIGWTDASWNPIAGCTKVGAGCENCYALRDSWRIAHAPRHPARYDGVVEKVNGEVQWTNTVNLDREALEQPLHWRKPRRVFVCSMSDLFHWLVPDAFVWEAWDVMSRCPQHTFQVLTKRAERMRELVNRFARQTPGLLDNMWLGVTAENQRWLERRVPWLEVTRAAVRFLSVEPMLGPVNMTEHLADMDWVILGAESGAHRRPCRTWWMVDAVYQCRDAGVPVFVKQIDVDGTLLKRRPGEPWPDDWPEALRVQEFPGTKEDA